MKNNKTTTGTFSGTVTLETEVNPGEVNDITQTFKRNALYETIGEFYEMGGAHEPVKTVGELMNWFFAANSECEVDAEGKPVKLYMTLNPNTVSNMVFMANAIKTFFVELESDWRNYPGNPANTTAPYTPFQ